MRSSSAARASGVMGSPVCIRPGSPLQPFGYPAFFSAGRAILTRFPFGSLYDATRTRTAGPRRKASQFLATLRCATSQVLCKTTRGQDADLLACNRLGPGGACCCLSEHRRVRAAEVGDQHHAPAGHLVPAVARDGEAA